MNDVKAGGSARPPAGAIAVARDISERIGARSFTPVRVAFVGGYDVPRAPGGHPPVAKLLRGGRGGEVRLKLELAFLWFAVSPPHDLSYPARAWAQLLGLEDPEGRGARRIRQAITALEEARLVDVRQRPGHPSTVYLLTEGGTGERYVLPGAGYRNAAPSEQWRHRYVRLPSVLWTKGWMAVLSGAAVAMLLVLLVEVGARPPQTTDVWFSPERAKRTYGLSEDTRSKGLRELRRAGLITAGRRSASRDSLDFRRLRNTYRLQPHVMNADAWIPAGETPAPSGPNALVDSVLADV